MRAAAVGVALLRWDDAPGAIVVRLAGRRSMLRIPAEAEKGGAHRLLPMAPEAAELLQNVPKAERAGGCSDRSDKAGAPCRVHGGP